MVSHTSAWLVPWKSQTNDLPNPNNVLTLTRVPRQARTKSKSFSLGFHSSQNTNLSNKFFHSSLPSSFLTISILLTRQKCRLYILQSICIVCNRKKCEFLQLSPKIIHMKLKSVNLQNYYSNYANIHSLL